MSKAVQICPTNDGKTPKSGANLSKWVEKARLEGKIGITELAKAIGIDRKTYRYKIKSFNGLTDLELCRAFDYFGVKVAILPKGIEIVTA